MAGHDTRLLPRNLRKKNVKPHLHLHVGLGKCASTSLQAFLATHRDVLRARGLDYPDLGTGLAGNMTAYALSQRPPEARWGARQFDFDTARERLNAALERSPCPNVLLSSEALTHPEHMLDLGWLYDAFRSVTVHLILRPRAAWLVAVYAQMVRAAGLHTDLNAFLDSTLVREGAQFARILQFWRASAGQDAVTLHMLRPQDLPIIDRVLHSIVPGVDLPDGAARRQNVTPSAFVIVAQAYAHQCALAGASPGPDNVAAMAARFDPNPSLSLLSTEVVRRIDAQFATDTTRFVDMQDVVTRADIEMTQGQTLPSGVTFDQVLAMPAFGDFAKCAGLPVPNGRGA